MGFLRVGEGWRSAILRRQVRAEPRKPCVPGSLEALHPGEDLEQRLGSEPVVDVAPLAAIRDEARVLQRAQVLRERGQGRGERLRELTHVALPLFQESFQQLTSRGVRDGEEEGVGGAAVGHAGYISRCLSVCKGGLETAVRAPRACLLQGPPGSPGREGELVFSAQPAPSWAVDYEKPVSKMDQRGQVTCPAYSGTIL